MAELIVVIVIILIVLVFMFWGTRYQNEVRFSKGELMAEEYWEKQWQTRLIRWLEKILH